MNLTKHMNCSVWGEMKSFVMTKCVVYMVTSVVGHYKAVVVFEATVLGI